MDRVAMAHQWAVDTGWVQGAEPTAALARWRGLAIQRGLDAQNIMIEMGVQWEYSGNGPQRDSGSCSAGWQGHIT